METEALRSIIIAVERLFELGMIALFLAWASTIGFVAWYGERIISRLTAQK